MVYVNRVNYFVRLYLDLITLSIIYIISKIIFNGQANSIIALPLQFVILTSFLCWYISARIFNLYTEIIFIPFSQELINLFRVVIAHLLVLVFILFLFSNELSRFRSIIIFYNLGITIILPFQKYFYRVITAYIRKQYKAEKKIIIVGNNFSNDLSLHSALSNNNLKYKLIGVVDDEKDLQSSVSYLGNLNQLEQLLYETEADEVLVSLPFTETEKVNRIISICEQTQTRINMLSHMNSYGAAALKVANYAGFSIVNIRYYPLDDPENKFFKRIFDILFSLCFLVFIFSWLFPIIAILIKITSKGPIFFKQERWGLNNEKINCLKFRTMFFGSSQVDENGIYIHTNTNDKRITPIGKFLRKTSIDELPQFLNVLNGGMSLIGPRPHPIPLSIEAQAKTQHYMLRHLVKPGITGWAQVNGSRGNVQLQEDMQKRINLDIWYIENWSFGLDLQIVFQTIINMIKGDENAH